MLKPLSISVGATLLADALSSSTAFDDGKAKLLPSETSVPLHSAGFTPRSDDVYFNSATVTDTIISAEEAEVLYRLLHLQYRVLVDFVMDSLLSGTADQGTCNGLFSLKSGNS